jgi:hypothetical protein
MHLAALALALLATRVGKHNAATRLLAHIEATPDWQTNPSFDWLRAEIRTELYDTGNSVALAPQALTRQQLSATITELDQTP